MVCATYLQVDHAFNAVSTSARRRLRSVICLLNGMPDLTREISEDLVLGNQSRVASPQIDPK